MAFEHVWLGKHIDYQKALEMQEKHCAELIKQKVAPTLFSLEHAPVYTIGRTRDKRSLHTQALLPHPVVEISRGGQATYHGPGQLVGYPLVDLRPLGRDLHRYIRILEQALIETCALYDVHASRREGLTGVWVEDRKIASIGVGVKKWHTLHGYAINLKKESLMGFLSITPCGIQGVQMTCLERESSCEIHAETFANQCFTQLHNLLF